MTVTLRPTDWRDLRVLHRNRSKGLYLDTARVLTRGGSFAPGVLRSFFSPATGAFTWICADECEQPILGQFAHIPGEPFARLILLAPDEALESANHGRFVRRTCQAGRRTRRLPPLSRNSRGIQRFRVYA